MFKHLVSTLPLPLSSSELNPLPPHAWLTLSPRTHTPPSPPLHPSPHSARLWLYTPLALVSTTGLSTSSGNSRCSRPALALWNHLRPASLGHISWGV